MEARRQAGEPHAGSVLSEGVDQDVAAGGVFGAHAPEVPVAAAGFNQQGQRELAAITAAGPSISATLATSYRAAETAVAAGQRTEAMSWLTTAAATISRSNVRHAIITLIEHP